jgi:DNA-binding transcriptional LysR family regulator
VRLDLGLGDELVNFVADGFDLAIRSAGSTTPVYCASSLNASAMWLVAYLDAPEHLGRSPSLPTITAY